MIQNSIVELVNLFDRFNKEKNSRDLKEFSLWLLRNDVKQSENIETNEIDLDRNLAYLINRLAKYSRFYTKKELAEYNINSIDEFYFLVSINKLGTPAKSDVYSDCIIELTTGAQIMKRLISMELVEEVPDKSDKRIKRVRLTEEGDKVRVKIFNKFTKTVKLKSGNLSKEAKIELLQTLKYLDQFHNNIYKSDNDKDIDELIAKYILHNDGFC